MIANAPTDFTEMVNMGMRLEEGVREGRLSKDEASTSKKYGSSFSKRKDNETNTISSGRIVPIISPQKLDSTEEPTADPRTTSLVYEVQKLMKSGIVSFEDRAPNVKANPLPAHENSSANMVDGCPGEYKVFDACFIRGSLVQIHKDICMVSNCEHDHDGCDICSVNPRGCVVVKRDIQRLMDEGMIQICQSHHVDDDVNVIVPIFKQPERLVIQYDSNSSKNVDNISVSSLVIRLAGPVPYASDKVVPYQYNATMIENRQEVPLSPTSSVVSIVDVTKVTRNGRVFGPVFPENK
ncbi:hypothetical protein KIW84_075023 [Lathyrus oleraceus]|uniref:Uncharacterized protein n=1 Tax=Pisum sativum TaxID=3888 RepID=A0A9D4VTV8_PEA|nr:hypothetical protein KIW84_075023 [Pisum sativum]